MEVVYIIIFDLDGTLYRTHETGLPTFREICDRHNILLTRERENYMLYTTTDSFLRKYAQDMTTRQRDEFKDEFKWREIAAVKEHGRLFKGIREMLATLAKDGHEMVICGMGSKEYIETVLEHCAITGYFRAAYHRIEGLSKAQVVKTILSDMNLDSNQCLMVGDSITDITAARENGIPFIGVSYGYGADDVSDADALVDSVEQLQAEIYRHIVFT